MKKIVLLTMLLIACKSGFSQITIAAARAMSVGSTVTIQGVVTNGNEFGIGLRYVQDATGGIACYSTALSNVKRGDNVTVTGATTLYNQLLEINVTTFTVNSSGNTLPTPLPITLASGYVEANEGMLCELTSVTFSAAGSSFAGNTNYNVTDGTTTQPVRINTYSNLAGERIPCSTTNVIGIMGQFSTSPTTGYQLLPRDVDDIQTLSLNQSSISTSGFTVSFDTKIAAPATLQYGLSPTSLTSTLTDAVSSTHHCFTLTGLLPATVFYVKATCGPVISCVVPMITQSTSSGRIRCYFNHQVDNSVAHGTNALYIAGDGDDTLSKYIDSTHTTLDIAIYNFDSPTLITAINNAITRGVAVRMVADNGVNTAGYNSINLTTNKKKAPAPSTTYGIMHNKFFVMDAADAARARVWTGSMNMTTQQVNSDENNVILFQDQSIAKAYTMEFEEMFNGNVFGASKSDNTPHEFNVNGKRVEVYFSPTDGTQSHIKEVVRSAEHDFYFALLNFTRPDIAYTIRDSVVGKGGFAAGIVDDTASASTVYFNCYQNDTLIIDHHSTQYHHKYCIADANKTCSDPTVLTGSHNWSNSANQKNDENTVVVHDADIANQYYQEFYYSFNEQGGNVALMPAYNNCGATPAYDPCAIGGGINTNSQNQPGFNLYPNPVSGILTISQLENGGTIEIINMIGEKVAGGVHIINNSQMAIDVSRLTNGMYFIKVITQNGVSSTKKFVKQ